MPDTTEGRVAVYIDFDNIVISRYQQVHGRSSFQRDSARELGAVADETPTEHAARLAFARVDLGAVLDYASSFGTVAISRAYADWSVPVNASYKDQLVGRAVDLVQMFPTVQSMKNGADIRMSVDVVEDLFRLPEITHVVIVSGDSDFIALAQRCRRLGRYIVGIGVAGGTSRALSAACNEYKDYDGLPGLSSDDDADDDMAAPEPEVAIRPVLLKSAPKVAAKASAKAHTKTKTPTVAVKVTTAATASGKGTDDTTASAERATVKPSDQRAATKLLRRALELGQSKDAEWIASSVVKNQMLRMDPTFQESVVGHKSFTDFIRSRHNVVDVREEGQLRWLRLRSDQGEQPTEG